MSRAVIDQPGVRILAMGLALSVLLGLALRSQITESRIQVFLNKSVDRLQPDFHIDYESAKVNLSNWGLPLPALVIQNIRLSPKSTLCQSSQIFIEELEIPISVSALLGLSKTVPKIRTKDIELRLSDVDDCLWQNKEALNANNTEAAESSEKSQPVAVISEPTFKNIFSNDTRAELKEIYVEKLKIISKKKPDQPIVLKQINFDLFYTQNHLSEVRIKSRINALKDARSDVYFLNSDFIAVLKANEANEIETVISINGKLLDGDVSFFSHSYSGTKKISYELGLEQVSVKAISPLIENINFYNGLNMDKTSISLSLVNKGEVYISEKTNIDSKFKNIILNVDGGLIKIDELETNYSADKFSVKPFTLKIESLPLSSLKNVDQLKSKLDSFEGLGELSGELDYKNVNSYNIKGHIKNVKAVFSNRGRRDLQIVEQIDIKGSRNGNELKIEALNFIINNEKINGQLQAQYNINNFNTTAYLKVSDVTLNNKIWEQFTFVEQSPRIQLVWNYTNSGIETHKIVINADEIFLPGIKLENLSVDISHVLSENQNENMLNVLIKPARLSTDSEFLENNIIRQVLNSANGFKLDSLNSNKTNFVLSGRDWKNINFNLESSFLSDLSAQSEMHLAVKGAVQYEEGLKAKLILRNREASLNFDLSTDQDDKIVIKRAQ